MPRRIALLLAALMAAVALVPLGGIGAAPARAADGSTDPLRVRIDTITPGYLPQTGPIRISGTVTNLDEITWTTVNLYSFVSDTPMTTEAELDAAGALPADAMIGNRIATPEASYTLPEIAPGDTLPFSIEVPRKLIEVNDQGVYWFGVQALGQGDAGRVLAGRDRTFLPLVKPRTAALPTAVVIPLRRQISYAPDGSLDDLDGWTKALSSGGRLRALVDLGTSAGSRAVTYLVDPSLLDAVGQLAAGNPPRSLAPTLSPGEEDGSTPSPSSTEGTDGSASAGASDQADSGDGTGDTGDDSGDGTGDSGDSGAPEPDPLVVEAQRVAADWLEVLGRALPGHQILALPYGDLDIAGAADHAPQTYATARKRAGAELAPYALPVDPAVAAPGGYLDDKALDLIDPADTVLISDAMFAGPKEAALADGSEPRVPTVASEGEHRILVTSSASTTGVGPGEPRSPLSVRQRTLAESAVRALSGDREPLVVLLPNDWNPASTSGFFSAFDTSWIDLSSVGEIAARPATPIDLGALTYPASQVRSELDSTSFAAAADLARAGMSLQNLLTLNDAVGRTIRDQALTTLSYTSRSRPAAAQYAAGSSARWVRDQLAMVHVDAPKAFTMTGTTGPFSATIVNDLDQPVTVSLRAQVDRDLTVRRPKRVEVPAAGKQPGKARVLMTAEAPTGGIHRVVLVVTDTEGTALGATDVMKIRSLQVSWVIWVFLGAAGAVLFGAIAFRLFKRIRAARRTPDEEAAAPSHQDDTAGSADTAETDA